MCSGKVIEGSTVTFESCDFSLLYNNIDFDIKYKNPVSGLVHRETGRLLQIYDVSTFSQLSKDAGDNAVGFVLGLTNTTG